MFSTADSHYKRKNLENEFQYIDTKKKLEKIKSDIEK